MTRHLMEEELIALETLDAEWHPTGAWRDLLVGGEARAYLDTVTRLLPALLAEVRRARSAQPPPDAEWCDFEERVSTLRRAAYECGQGRDVEAGSAEVAVLSAFKGLRDEVALLTHKVLTCGVAASHPDAALSRRGAYAGKWDSPQAEEVRQLRARAEAAERERDEARSESARNLEVAKACRDDAEAAESSLSRAREEAIRAVDAEPELDGPILPALLAAVQERPEDVLRATVRETKRGIRNRLRAASPGPAAPTTPEVKP